MKAISAIFLTLNEEGFLPGCLQSLSWTDEIVVVDAGSTDRTLEIAKTKGAKIIRTPWQGFPKQRDVGAKEAKGEWIFYVDADERVSKELREEIQALLKQKESLYRSYRIPHKNMILGRWLRYGGWYPDDQHRLIEKQAFKGWAGELHEHPNVEGSVGTLKGELLHFTHRGILWMLEKTIRYTQLEAELRLKEEHPMVKIRHLLTAPFRELWFRGVKESGWRDGIRGWIEILYQAFNQFLIMVWLWEMQQEKTMKKTYQDLDREISDEL
ncbi:MAG: hypothetical protein A3F04_01190 [Candidatus Chisholmbacteria bacterium RIFCSPHIGHO2_12_FULL_49_9]|nr:MAG: hypothetical protein A3F04_01190 [Candidatus Chisholmbacteria bacterium RIFCSPHIGHO2_12_FULL_49_9]